MATGLSTTAAGELMTTLVTKYKYVQLHKGDPGSAGTLLVATEATRKLVTWLTGTGATRVNDGELIWSAVAGSEDYTHFTVWDQLATGGTFGFSGTVTSNAVTAGDTFTIPSGSLSAQLPTAS